MLAWPEVEVSNSTRGRMCAGSADTVVMIRVAIVCSGDMASQIVLYNDMLERAGPCVFLTLVKIAEYNT